MNDQWWGWILSVFGLAGFYVTGKKIWWGWWLNVAAQAVWYAYAIFTAQWGFLVMTTMYTIMFTKNALEWTKEHKGKKGRVAPGVHFRPVSGSCPGCGATQGSWCKQGCLYLDPMDYR